MSGKIKRVTIVKFSLLSILVLYLFFNIINDYEFKEINMLISLVSSIILIYKSRKEVGSSLVFIFLFVCLVQISPEYLFSVRTTAYDYFYTEDMYNLTLAIITIFIAVLSIFYNNRQVNNISFNNSNKNNLLFGVLYLICIYILLFGVSRGVGSSYTVSIKTIYEYFIMVYLFAYYYSPKSNFSKYMLLFLAGIYVIQDFYYGGRISSVQLIILVSILFFNKLRLREISLLSLFGYCILKAVEIYRVSYSILAFGFENFLGIIFNNPFDSYKWNTFSEVLYSSSALVYVKENIFASSETMDSLLSFIINIFLGGVKPLGNIVAHISKNISKVGGGGFLPAYLYFWLGWIGVFLSAFLIVRLLNFESNEKSTHYHQLLYILVLSMFPRWFLYSPLILLRYVLFNYSILYVFLWIANQLTRKKRTTSITYKN